MTKARVQSHDYELETLRDTLQAIMRTVDDWPSEGPHYYDVPEVATAFGIAYAADKSSRPLNLFWNWYDWIGHERFPATVAGMAVERMGLCQEAVFLMRLHWALIAGPAEYTQITGRTIVDAENWIVHAMDMNDLSDMMKEDW